MVWEEVQEKRKTTIGNPIGEWSAPNGLFPSTRSVPAITDPNRRAYAYDVASFV